MHQQDELKRLHESSTVSIEETSNSIFTVVVDGATYTLDLDKNPVLGKGAFARSYRLRDPETQDPTDIVLKMPHDRGKGFLMHEEYKELPASERAGYRVLEAAGGTCLLSNYGGLDLNKLFSMDPEMGGMRQRSLNVFSQKIETVNIFLQMLNRVGALHADNIFHMDLHFGNVVYHRQNDELRLIDFGVSKKVML